MEVRSVVLGERWGCAMLATAASSSVQCWDAPLGRAASVQAFTVPWLSDRRGLQAGPDRICDFTGHLAPELTFRCWQRPTRGASQGQELPADQQWQNPHGTSWNDAYSRSDRVGSTFVGGTFSCLQATRDDSVWCLGDNRFGQLGGSSAVPSASAERDDPAFVQHIWPAERVVLGTWHACAMAAPDGLADGGHIACWGRGDHGQLGAPAPDRCEVDGAKVACARTALAGVQFKHAMLDLVAGDLYTCLTRPDEISCWGASRDGFFGTSAECPASLRRAWPTLHGSVPAPRAACSRKPAKIPNVRGFQQRPSAGPRGICFDDDTPLRCVGGVRTPRGKGIRQVVVSPGEDAAACGIRDGGAVCWGEGYSPANAPDLPLAITLEPRPDVAEVAFIGPSDPSPYSASCLVRRGCDFGPEPLARCPAKLEASDWSALRESANAHLGEVVHVRGAVAVGGMHSTMAGCGASDGIGCCNRSGASIVLGDTPALRLDGLFCSGDDSGACCNAPAYGDTLIAAGRLEAAPSRGHDRRLSGYQLTSVKLCKPD